MPTPIDAPEDVLGLPYRAETIELEPDFEGAVVTTLVSRPSETPTTRAVLYVHGFSDYFFQTQLAQWWTDRGYDFYALDLRKYGRSLRPHQTPAFVTDLHQHFEDVDAAWSRVTTRDRHTEVVVMGHSTGGLVLPLWADARQPEELTGMVLNSPWLEFQGSTALRVAGTPLVKVVGKRKPKAEIGRDVTGFYARGLHKDFEGEWDFDLDWKPVGSMKVYTGWLRAIRIGHARVHRGLDINAPVLVLSSDRSGHPIVMDELVHSTDIVLDVDQIRRWSVALGDHVTYVAIPGAIHDVVLSRPAPRKQAYGEIDRWVRAYVEEPSTAEAGQTV